VENSSHHCSFASGSNERKYNRHFELVAMP
jgi:hypothetical protein